MILNEFHFLKVYNITKTPNQLHLLPSAGPFIRTHPHTHRYRSRSSPLYSLSDDELLWILSMKSSAIFDTSLPASCVGCPLLEYGAHAARGLQSARMSRMRNDEVTVRCCEPAEICACCRCGGRPWPPWPPPPPRPGLWPASSTHSRLDDGDGGGDEQPLSASERDGLNSSGERHSPARLPPLDTGLPGLWDSSESMPKLDPLADASIVSNRAASSNYHLVFRTSLYFREERRRRMWVFKSQLIQERRTSPPFPSAKNVFWNKNNFPAPWFFTEEKYLQSQQAERKRRVLLKSMLLPTASTPSDGNSQKPEDETRCSLLQKKY